MMHQFFISPKMAKQLLSWTAVSIVVLSVACVILDMEDEDLPQTVKLDSQTVTQITSEIDKTNILLKGQSVKLDEIDNSLVGILGIAKGTLELAPSLKPEINVQPGRQRPQRKPHKDSLTIETTQHSTDSIVITVNHGDSIVTTPHYEKIPSSQTGKKFCCCNCCCNGCRKDGCR